jgi:hypothetical protein
MFEEVMKRYREKSTEHRLLCRIDPYYAHCHGGGKVPSPSCASCENYDDGVCMKEWNDLDPAYYIADRDDKEPSDLCDDYKWNCEWEDE